MSVKVTIPFTPIKWEDLHIGEAFRYEEDDANLRIKISDINYLLYKPQTSNMYYATWKEYIGHTIAKINITIVIE